MKRLALLFIALLALSFCATSAFATQYVAPSNGANQSFGSSNLLFLDNTNGRVGVGDTTPTNKLDVNGAIGISDTAIIDASRNIVNAGTGSFSGALSATTLNTGQGAYELYAMDQNVLTTSAPTFATVNTGQGAYELYAMDQNVLTTSAPTFATGTTISGTRPVSFDSNNGIAYIKGDAGGWGVMYGFKGSSNTDRGGFGALGSADGLTYYWIGNAYNTATEYVYPGGGVHIGSTASNPGAGALSLEGGLTATTGGFSGAVNINGAITGNSKTAFETADTYLRINQGSSFTSGIWIGSSNLMGSSGYLAMGSNGGTTTSRVYINSGTYNGANVINLDGSNSIVTASSFSGAGTGLTGTAASLNIGGNAATATWASYISAPDGDRDAATKLPTTTTHGVRYDFVQASTTGTGGNYAGVMTYAPWDGTTASTGDASYQLAFGSTAVNGGGIPKLNIRKGIDSTWNSWYTILHSGNYNDYAPTLTGTGASGTWGIAISGNAATATTAGSITGQGALATLGAVSGGAGGTITDTTITAADLASGDFSSKITSGTYSIAISGNAGTATALAANGANCAAGQYPLGVDASGAVESCTAVGSSGSGGNLSANAVTGAIAFFNNATQVNGTTNLYWDNTNGRLGINTNAPNQALQVVGNANISGTLYASNISSNSPLRLMTAGTTRLYINDTTGFVGINTTNATSLLTVAGTARVTDIGIILNTSSAQNTTTQTTTSSSLILMQTFNMSLPNSRLITRARYRAYISGTSGNGNSRQTYYELRATDNQGTVRVISSGWTTSDGAITIDSALSPNDIEKYARYSGNFVVQMYLQCSSNGGCAFDGENAQVSNQYLDVQYIPGSDVLNFNSTQNITAITTTSGSLVLMQTYNLTVPSPRIINRLHYRGYVSGTSGNGNNRQTYYELRATDNQGTVSVISSGWTGIDGAITIDSVLSQNDIEKYTRSSGNSGNIVLQMYLQCSSNSGCAFDGENAQVSNQYVDFIYSYQGASTALTYWQPLLQYNIIAGANGLGVNNTNPSYTVDTTGSLRTTGPTYLATTSGSVGIGNTAPSFTLDVTGTLRTTGAKTGFLSDIGQASENGIEKGDLVAISYDGIGAIMKGGNIPIFKVRKSRTGDADIVGVVFEKLLRDDNYTASNGTAIIAGDRLQVATHNSITFLKASAENGPIVPGDYLMPGRTPGYAMKADQTAALVIGRALEALPNGTAQIDAFISITPTVGVSNINTERLQTATNAELKQLGKTRPQISEQSKREALSSGIIPTATTAPAQGNTREGNDVLVNLGTTQDVVVTLG